MNKYYTQYPTRADRKENPFHAFVEDYYEDDPNVAYEVDAAGFPTDAYLDRRKALQKRSAFSMRMPNPSAYNLFTKRIVKAAYDMELLSLADIDAIRSKEDQEKIDEIKRMIANEKSIPKGWFLALTAQLWDVLVKTPFIRAAAKTKAWAKSLSEFKQNKGIAGQLNDKQMENFIKTFMSHKEVKEALKAYVSPMLTRKTPEFANIFALVLGEIKKILAPIYESVSQSDL